MSADTESDVWERAVCAFCGAVLGGVAGFAVEMLRAATVGAPMSIAVVGIFVLIGAVLGLWIGFAIANGIVALCSFLVGWLSALSPEAWFFRDGSTVDWKNWAVPTSVEAQDRFLDLLTATVCEVAVDANASEPSFLQYAKRTDVVRGRSGVQWTFRSLGKKNL
jgi:hypothetical protein